MNLNTFLKKTIKGQKKDLRKIRKARKNLNKTLKRV
jgi:hypothetical protein